MTATVRDFNDPPMFPQSAAIISFIEVRANPHPLNMCPRKCHTYSDLWPLSVRYSMEACGQLSVRYSMEACGQLSVRYSMEACDQLSVRYSMEACGQLSVRYSMEACGQLSVRSS